MSNELEAALIRVVTESVETILDCCEGLSATALNWRPEGDTNSLQAIATHTMANAERNILSSYCGQPYAYDRDAEFAAIAQPADVPLRERWRELLARVDSAVRELPPEAFTRDCEHVRMGRVKGWQVLVQVSRHAAEHMGEARLTRQLVDGTTRERVEV